VLAEQHELEFVELTPGSIDPSAALLLISFLARRYRALPIRFLDDGSVLIAVADPTNVMFSDGLRLATGMAVRICVAAPDAIEAAIVSVIDGDETELEALTPENDAHADENLLDLNADSPAVVFVNRSIAAALDAGASDIHFTPNTADRQLTTIEDPVEYRVEGLDQVEANIRAGLTFAGGLRTILRSDPDVLLVGEIRDEETA
jgi:type II secretory ATPase GspE/PulE/Tfp pilus assembly ATPase PilB-like protein